MAGSDPQPAFDPDVSLWEPWTPAQVAERLAGVELPWYVAAGWALDLFRGRRTRTHEDIEIGVPHDRFDAVRERLAELEFFVVGGGRAWPLETAGDAVHTHHQTWGRDPSTGRWRIDVLREPYEGQSWIFRRDAAIRLPYEQIIRWTPEGIPFLAPEVVLLFKAGAAHAKDEDDFRDVLPLLDAARRGWLLSALRQAHPAHAWIGELEEQQAG